MKAKLLKRSRRGCKIEKRNNKFRFIEPGFLGLIYDWQTKTGAESHMRWHILNKARRIYKPAKQTLIKY